MAITGTEIRVDRARWMDGRRAGAIGVALVVTLAAGVLLGRVTAPTAPAATRVTTVSTRWIDSTSVRDDVMRGMNAIGATAPSLAGYLETTSIRAQVMDAMNGLSSPPVTDGFVFGSSVRPDVMRAMNEIPAG